jgi:hypothetical protein
MSKAIAYGANFIKVSLPEWESASESAKVMTPRLIMVRVAIHPAKDVG